MMDDTTVPTFSDSLQATVASATVVASHVTVVSPEQPTRVEKAKKATSVLKATALIKKQFHKMPASISTSQPEKLAPGPQHVVQYSSSHAASLAIVIFHTSIFRYQSTASEHGRHP